MKYRLRKFSRRAAFLAVGALAALLITRSLQAQSLPPVVLQLDVDNFVTYVVDTSDVSKFATNPNITPANDPTFVDTIGIADIVAVNGQAAKGTWSFLARRTNLTTASTPRQSIADTSRQNLYQGNWEILAADGTAIGTLMAVGLSGPGPPPPGSPVLQGGANIALAGGTGAFLGVSGTQGGAAVYPSGTAIRRASIVEDPAFRRQNGGGKSRLILVIIPSSRPQVLMTANGPAIAHASDFTTVSGSKPAAPGEILALVASGLGPTRAGVDPGQPFPTAPLAVVNSPVIVTVNGKPADVLGAVGYPGTVDAYQVNFRLPPDTAKGSATVQVIAAWIPGPSVNIMVQ